MILAIDPGTHVSAFVVYDPLNQKMEEFGIYDNFDLLKMIAARKREFEAMPIEMIASYGMPVGQETFETCVWIGRFIQEFGPGWHYVYRKDVKMHFCMQTKGVNDAVIRQALTDKFGPGRSKAVGTKLKPGPLYGISKDVWAALAVAVTWSETIRMLFPKK